MITKRPSLDLAQPPSTSWIRSLKTIFSTHSEDSLQCQVLLCITNNCYCSDLVHVRANWIVLKLSKVVHHPTQLPMPSSRKSSRNWCYRIENTSLFPLPCIQLCQRGISTAKVKIYTIDGSKYCAKNKCTMMITVPRWEKHLLCGTNRPSDISVTVNISAEFNLSLFWWLLTPKLNAFEGIPFTSIVTV
jgi:hypothetical protein